MKSSYSEQKIKSLRRLGIETRAATGQIEYYTDEKELSWEPDWIGMYLTGY